MIPLIFVGISMGYIHSAAWAQTPTPTSAAEVDCARVRREVEDQVMTRLQPTLDGRTELQEQRDLFGDFDRVLERNPELTRVLGVFRSESPHPRVRDFFQLQTGFQQLLSSPATMRMLRRRSECPLGSRMDLSARFTQCVDRQNFERAVQPDQFAGVDLSGLDSGNPEVCVSFIRRHGFAQHSVPVHIHNQDVMVSNIYYGIQVNMCKNYLTQRVTQEVSPALVWYSHSLPVNPDALRPSRGGFTEMVLNTLPACRFQADQGVQQILEVEAQRAENRPESTVSYCRGEVDRVRAGYRQVQAQARALAEAIDPAAAALTERLLPARNSTENNDIIEMARGFLAQGRTPAHQARVIPLVAAFNRRVMGELSAHFAEPSACVAPPDGNLNAPISCQGTWRAESGGGPTLSGAVTIQVSQAFYQGTAGFRLCLGASARAQPDLGASVDSDAGPSSVSARSCREISVPNRRSRESDREQSFIPGFAPRVIGERRSLRELARVDFVAPSSRQTREDEYTRFFQYAGGILQRSCAVELRDELRRMLREADGNLAPTTRPGMAAD